MKVKSYLVGIDLENAVGVLVIGVGEGMNNIYVEKPNNDLKFVTGLSKKKGGKKPTDDVIEEFVIAAGKDELANSGLTIGVEDEFKIIYKA